MSDYTMDTDLVEHAAATWHMSVTAGAATYQDGKNHFRAWLAQHDAEVAANTTLGIAHRIDTDDPRVGEQLVQFEDEWRKEARGRRGGAA